MRLILVLLFTLVGQCFGQASPYSNSVFPSNVFNGSGQTSVPIRLNGLSVDSTVGSGFATCTVTVAGSGLTTVSFQVLGSSDNGVTFVALPATNITTGALSTTVTATSNGVYQTGCSGITHVEFVTSGTFTAAKVTLTLTASPVTQVTLQAIAALGTLPNSFTGNAASATYATTAGAATSAANARTAKAFANTPTTCTGLYLIGRISTTGAPSVCGEAISANAGGIYDLQYNNEAQTLGASSFTGLAFLSGHIAPPLAALPADLVAVLKTASGCSTTGYSYNPATNTCTAAGDSPGGSDYSVQYALSGTFGGASINGPVVASTTSAPRAATSSDNWPGTAAIASVATQATGAYNALNTFDVAQAPGSTVNNGVATYQGLGTCNVYGCSLDQGLGSISTEQWLTAINQNNTHFHTAQYGQNVQYTYNAGYNNASFGYMTDNYWLCMRNAQPLYINGGQSNCNSYSDTFAAPSSYHGNSWTIHSTHYTNSFYTTRVLGQMHSDNMFSYSLGDKAWLYAYHHCRAGAVGVNDEGCSLENLQLLQDPAPRGTVSSVLTGANVNNTMIKLSITSNLNTFGDAGYLIDRSNSFAGLINSVTGPASNGYGGTYTYTMNTSDTHAVSTAWGTLTAACGPALANRNAPISNTCNINMESGTFLYSGQTGYTPVCVADVGNAVEPEHADVTATGTGTVTIALAYQHPAGVRIYQGDPCGRYLAMGAGTTDPSVNDDFTQYFIAGARTSTSIDAINLYKGGQQNGGGYSSALLIKVPQNVTENIGSVYRNSSGLVSFANGNYSFIPWIGRTIPNGATMAISVTGTVDGPVTNYLSQGSGGSGTVQSATHTVGSASSGTLAITGLNNYVAYCGAEIVGLGNTGNGYGGTTLPVTPSVQNDNPRTANGDGTTQLEPNWCFGTSSVGHNIVQPNFYSPSYLRGNEYSYVNTPSNNAANAPTWRITSLSGLGWADGATIDYLTTNNQNNMYIGRGGYAAGVTLFHTNLPLLSGWEIDQAPMQGGHLWHIGLPPSYGTITDFTTNYDLMQMDYSTGGNTTVSGQGRLIWNWNTAQLSMYNMQIVPDSVVVKGSRRGTFNCTAGGTITVANSNYIQGSDVIITMYAQGGTITTPPAFKTVTGGTGFSILCAAADTSTYQYSILN